MKKRLLQMGLVLAVASMAMAEVVVTAVSVQKVEGKKMAEVELNKALKIREIEVREVGGKISLKYPEYVNPRGGRRYPDMEVLDEAAEKVIIKAIKSGKAETVSSKNVTYKVSEIFRLRGKTRLANAKVDFFGSVRVVFGVMKSNRPGSDPYWVSDPGRPKKPGETGRGYIKKVFITNRALKEAVYEDIIKKFKEDGGSE